MYKVKNNAESTLASGITADATSLTVATNEGALFPTGNFLISIEDEILLCTSRTDDILTVVRAQEGTTASAHSAGKAVELRITAGIIQELQNELGTKATISTAQTITNKRNQKRVYSTTSASSLTPEIDTYDIFEFTALAAALTINNHSTSTPANGEMMEFVFKDNGTARGLTWGDKYVAGGVVLPTTTVISKVTRVLVQWHSTNGKWHCITSITEA